MSRPSLTYSTALLIQAIAAGFRYGFDIMDATGLPSGTVYPALRRLERRGLLEGRWEEESRARSEGRPSRRYYILTPLGAEVVEEARSRYPGVDRAVGAGESGARPAEA